MNVFTQQLKYCARFVISPDHISGENLSAGLAWVPAPEIPRSHREDEDNHKMFLYNCWRCKVYSEIGVPETSLATGVPSITVVTGVRVITVVVDLWPHAVITGTTVILCTPVAQVQVHL